MSRTTKRLIDELIVEVMLEREYLPKIFKAIDAKMKSPSEEKVMKHLRNISVPYKTAKDISSKYMASKSMAEDSKYQAFFKSMLKKHGVSSPDEFESEEEKKAFFDKIDAEWDAEEETDIDEMTNSGNIQGYNVPSAFSYKGSRKKKDKDNARIAHGKVAKQIHKYVDNMYEGISIGDNVRVKKGAPVVDKKLIGKMGMVTHVKGRELNVEFPNGRTIAISKKDVEMGPQNESKGCGCGCGCDGKTKLNENVYGSEGYNDWATKLKKAIKAPFVSVTTSTLGGEERASIIISVSLDPKKDWNNGIFQNSRHAKFSINHDGTLQMITASWRDVSKFRKTRVKTIKDVASKIQKWIVSSNQMNEATYREFKRDESLSSRQKIGKKIKEINGSLYRIEIAVKQAKKLKTERGVSPENYWNSTHRKMNKISERILKIARDLREMK